MKLFFKVFILLIVVVFASCEAEKSLIHSGVKEYSAKTITYEQFVNETGLTNFKNEINPSISPTDIQSKTIDGKYELSDFNIDTDVIKSMEYQQKKTYTLQIHPKGISSENYFNLILYKKNNIWEKTIIEMKPSADNLFKLQNNLTDNFQGQMRQLYNSEVTPTSTMKCTSVTIVSNHCTGCQGECNCNLSCCVSEITYNICDFGPSTPYLGGGGNPNGNGDSGWGGGEGGTSDGSNENTVVIEPNLDNGISFLSAEDIIKERLFYNSLTSLQKEWVNANRNIYSLLTTFQIQNNWSNESVAIANNAITKIQVLVFDNTDYPGKNDNMPFEWWKNTDYIKENLKIIPDSNTMAETPNALEVFYFSQYPLQAIKHIANSLTSLSLAQNSGFTGLENGRADAFRHAYWNAKDTADFGKDVTSLFTTAHEFGTNEHTLVTTMDLFNNEQGRNIGENYNIMTPNSTIQTQITNAVNSGTLKYLDPLDADRQVIPTTTLKWTNL